MSKKEGKTGHHDSFGSMMGETARTPVTRPMEGSFSSLAMDEIIPIKPAASSKSKINKVDNESSSSKSSKSKRRAGPGADSYDSLGSGSSNSTAAKTSRAVKKGRVVFFICLFVVAALLGWSAFYFLSLQEQELAESQFAIINERAVHSAVEIAYRKFLGGNAVASVISQALPDAEPWPFVDMKGYNSIVDNIVPTSLSKGLNFAPIVLPEQVEEWEEYTQQLYDEYFGPDIEPKPGVNSFGFGIWAKDSSLDNEDKRFHDITGDTAPNWESPNQILVPKMHHAFWNSRLLLFNCHYPKPHGMTIDSIIECSEERAKSDDPESIACGAISEFSYSNTPELGPGGFMAMPIYPANDPTTLTGFVVGFLIWQEVLENIFGEGVNGVDCVISDSKTSYTYSIVNGSPVFRDEGDHHNPKYTDHGQHANLIDKSTMLVNNFTETFTLSIYPNEELFETYSTKNPMLATIGAVVAILLTSLMFILYDYCVRRDISDKKNLLDAKRQFVRFVSHEVRTPLNSVCMGLALLQEEITRSIGFRSVDSMLEKDDQQIVEACKKKGDQKADSFEFFKLVTEVQANAQSSVDVLNDLLNYDKVESGTLSLDLSAIPIWDLIEATVNEFKLPAANKKINLSVHFPQERIDEESPAAAPKGMLELCSIGDVIRITQVLRNLLSNAIKFTGEGRRITVTCDWLDRDTACPSAKTFEIKNNEEVQAFRHGKLVLKVKDEGAGMTEEQVSKLFQQGVQFNPNDLQKGNGSGLGLYISKGIMDQHNGNLSCDSEGMGKGTTFTMELPLYNCPSKNIRSSLFKQEDDTESTSQDFSSSSLRVLIVDDASSNRKLLRRLLENRGHQCSECEDGHLAIQEVEDAMLRQEPYDVILLDYEMRVLNGPEAAEGIRKLGCDAFMVGITGNILSDDVDYFRSKGVMAVLPKPFKMQDLEELLIEFNVASHRQSLTVDTIEFDMKDKELTPTKSKSMKRIVSAPEFSVLMSGPVV